MAMELPDFKNEFLKAFNACAMFDCDEHVAPFEKIAFQTTYATSSGDFLARMVAELEPSGTEGHLHFDIGRKSAKDLFEDLKPLDAVEASELRQLAKPLFGQIAMAYLSAEYVIPRGRLGKRSLIPAMLGFSTHSCGSTLILDGASMSIVDDVFTRLRWSFDDESQAICAELSAKIELPITPQYLIDAAELMQRGFDCFVMETGKEEHVADTSREVREIAQG